MLQSWQMGTENIQITRLRKLILKTLHIHKVSETLPLIVTEMCDLHSHTENVSVSTCRVENTDVWSRNNNQQQRQTSFLLFKLFSRSVLSFVWWIFEFLWQWSQSTSCIFEWSWDAVVSLSKCVTNCPPHNNVQMIQHKLSYCLWTPKIFAVHWKDELM